MLKRLNPFRGLENPLRVWAWGMFDLANQSFTLLIITLLFSLYVKGVVSSDADQGAFAWSVLHGGSLLLVVLVSPIIGAMADAGGIRKKLLIWTGIACSLLTCSLAFVGPGAFWLALLLYVPANVCYQVGENLLASFLPDVSTPRTVGRVSATGWTMGYVGALLLLVLTFAGMIVFDLRETEEWRPLFVFAGLWFLAGLIPAALLLDESKPDSRATTGSPLSLVRLTAERLGSTLRHASRFRQLIVFLSGFFVFAFGVQTVIGFASIIAEDFGFRQTQLVLFVAQITITAGIAAFVTSRFQDRIGARLTVLIYLAVWIVSCLGLTFVTAMAAFSSLPDPPSWSLWVIGNGLGFGLGGVGTASRALVARFTPAGRNAEFFGLWGMVYKLAGAIGVLSFGTVRHAVGEFGSMVLLTTFFVVGAAVTLGVNERTGVRAAKRAEREAHGAPPR